MQTIKFHKNNLDSNKESQNHPIDPHITSQNIHKPILNTQSIKASKTYYDSHQKE